MTARADDEPDATARLLRRARGTPRDGFAALHQRLQGPLRLWAELHLRAPLRLRLQPEDLVQEVWARAYAAFGTFDHARSDFRAWLFGIAYNVLREQLRSMRSSGRREPDGAAALDPVDPRTTVRTGASRDEQGALLLAHAEHLPEDERRLLVWRGLEGLPFAAIGARLGITAVAADSRWRRLCERLRAAFPDWIEV